MSQILNAFQTSFLLLLVLVCSALAEPNPSASPLIPPDEFYRRALLDIEKSPPSVVSAEETQKAIKAGDAILVDLRSEQEFQEGHIHGAINIPVTDLTDEILGRRLPDKSKVVIIYCEFNLFPVRRIALTTQGYPALRQLGYKNVNILEDLWARRSNKSSAIAEATGDIAQVIERAGFTFERSER